MSTVPNRGIAAPKQSHRQVGRGLWQWCSSREALLVLLLLLAAALALSYAFPQTPAYVRSDPTTYEEWLSTIQVQYKSWTSPLEALGILNIRETTWFRMLLALLMFVLLVSLAEHASKLVGSDRTAPALAFSRAPDVTTMSAALPEAEAVNRIQRALEQLGLKVRREHGKGTTILYGHRARWAAADTLATYLGAAFIVTALAVNGRWGWQQRGIRLGLGTPAFLGPEANSEVELIDERTLLDQAVIQVEQYDRITVRRDRSTYHKGYYYQLTDQSGSLVQVQAYRSNGTGLALSEYVVRPELRDALQLTFSATPPQDETTRLFIVPDEKLVVRLEWFDQEWPPTARQPRFRQWVFEQGGETLVGEAQIEMQNGTATTQIGSITYNWSVAPYVVVDVFYQPGGWVFGIGTAFVVAGLLGQLIPCRQAWSTIRSQNDRTMISIQTQSKGLARRWKRQRDETLAVLQAELESLR